MEKASKVKEISYGVVFNFLMGKSIPFQGAKRNIGSGADSRLEGTIKMQPLHRPTILGEFGEPLELTVNGELYKSIVDGRVSENIYFVYAK